LAFTAGLVPAIGAVAVLAFTAGLVPAIGAVAVLAFTAGLVARGSSAIGAVAVSGPIGARAKGLVINIMSATVCAGSSSGSNVDAVEWTAKPTTEVGLLALPGVFGTVTEAAAACRRSGILGAASTGALAGGLDLVARLAPAATRKIVIKPRAKTTKWDAVSAKLNGDDVRDSPSLRLSLRA